MIKEKIKKNKVLPLDQFIDFCLYKFKDSYYQKKNFLDTREILLPPHIYLVFFQKY